MTSLLEHLSHCVSDLKGILNSNLYIAFLRTERQVAKRVVKIYPLALHVTHLLLYIL